MYHNQGSDIYNRPIRITYIYMGPHMSAEKMEVELLLIAFNKGTNAMQEKMKKKLQTLSLQYQIQELKKQGK